jgi:TolB protein
MSKINRINILIKAKNVASTIRFTLFCFFVLLSAYNISAQISEYKEVQLTNNSFDNSSASYNKVGGKIIFESNRDGNWQIYIMEARGKRQKRLIKSTANDRRPTWHPYKNIVLFESDRSGINELYTLDMKTKIISKIPISLTGNKSFGQFAPNGVEIMFSLEDTKEDFDIYITHSKGRKPKKIVNDSYFNKYPRYSPRGDNIVYSSNKNNERETDVIYLYNIITEERKRLSYFKDHSFNPVWSYDGRMIVYAASIKDEKSEIYTMRSDGVDKRRITFNNTEDLLPSWSPNRTNLLVTRLINGNYHIVKIFLEESAWQPRN